MSDLLLRDIPDGLIDGLKRHSRQMGMTYSRLAQDWLKKGLISARLEALIEGHKPLTLEGNKVVKGMLGDGEDVA